MELLISLVLAIVIAFLITGAMKAKMDTAQHQRAAANYIRENSFELTQSDDKYLYQNTTRTPRPKSNDNDDDHDDGGDSDGGDGGGDGGDGGD